MAGKNRIVIPCRLAYLNCWKPNTKFGKEMYSLVALIKKTDTETLASIQEAIDCAAGKATDKWGGRVPPNLRSPLHDGDTDKPDNPVFQNCYYLNAKCNRAPQVVNQNVEPITEQSEMYSGCYGNVSLVFYGYNCGGNKGIAVWLGNIQKIKDGPKLNGHVTAFDEFQPLTYGAVLGEEDEE